MRDVERLLRVPDARFHVIGLFAQEYQPDDLLGRYELLKAGFDDNYDAGDVEMSAIAGTADDASDVISNRLRSGKTCVSSCAMGLNRSGLVSALALMKSANMGPSEAIGRIRRLRSPKALGNPKFVETIHKMGDIRGSKGAWTKWSRLGINT
jgi:hypothetical protein